jgi:hypothetical protein
LKLTSTGFQGIGVMFLGPIVGVAFLAFVGLATSRVEFGTSSNFAASAGYGPNQTSAMLSLGALLAIFVHLCEKKSNLLRAGFAILTIWLLAQAALTFSRTGLYLFGASLSLAAVFLVQWKGRGRRFLLFAIVLTTTALAALPILDAFTGGQLMERFKDKGLTGRERIAEEELELWAEKPILGQGVGMATYYRGLRTGGHVPPAHTEYTRLLAEHGLLGAGALAILLVLTGQAFVRAQGPWAKAVVAAFCLWCLLFMFVSAMRLAAPAFLLGLVHAQFVGDAPACSTAPRAFRLFRARRRLPYSGAFAQHRWTPGRNEFRK